MSTYYFKENEKSCDSSKFFAWKIRLEIIVDDNYAWEYIQGKVYEPSENTSAASKNKYKKCELKVKKIILDGLQDHLLAYVGI